MTCIIGFTDRANNISWVGGDSLGSDGYVKSAELPAKVFRNETFKSVLIGGTTTFRHLDLLKYSEDLFDEVDLYKKTELDHKFMVTQFIPKVIKLFKEGVVGEIETERGGNFIVATPHRVFEIQPDYSVLEPELGICAVGCGREVAMGEPYHDHRYGYTTAGQNRHGAESSGAILLRSAKAVPHPVYG